MCGLCGHLTKGLDAAVLVFFRGEGSVGTNRILLLLALSGCALAPSHHPNLPGLEPRHSANFSLDAVNSVFQLRSHSGVLG